MLTQWIQIIRPVDKLQRCVPWVVSFLLLALCRHFCVRSSSSAVCSREMESRSVELSCPSTKVFVFKDVYFQFSPSTYEKSREDYTAWNPPLEPSCFYLLVNTSALWTALLYRLFWGEKANFVLSLHVNSYCGSSILINSVLKLCFIIKQLVGCQTPLK